MGAQRVGGAQAAGAGHLVHGKGGGLQEFPGALDALVEQPLQGADPALGAEAGLSALRAGLAFLPMTGLIAVTNVVAGKLAGRYGAKPPMLVGQALAVAGLIVLLYVDAGTSSVLTAVLLVPLALGCALTVPPLTAAMMDAVPVERAGLAAGVLNAARQVAGGLGIAVFGSLVEGGFVDGMRVALLISAGALALTWAAALRLR